MTDALNRPATHSTVTGAAVPDPFMTTLRPVSQVPEIAAVGATKLFAEGLKIATIGAVPSRKKERESEVELPAPSV